MEETETIPVRYFIDVEFDDVSGAQPFGPISTRAKAEDVLQTLASRTDVRKATLRREAVI